MHACNSLGLLLASVAAAMPLHSQPCCYWPQQICKSRGIRLDIPPHCKEDTFGFEHVPSQAVCVSPEQCCAASAEASQPEDWDEEEDGEWEPPKVPNPKCAEGPGCGQWKRPMKPNPDYKGAWTAPLIDNPEYKVRPPNPDPDSC